MGRSTITIAIFLIIIFADVSNASSFWKLRYLADESPTKDNTTAAAPPNSSAPSASPGEKKLDPKADSPSKVDLNPLNKTDSATPPPEEKKDSKPSAEPEKVSPPPQKETNGGSNSSASSSSNSNNDKPMKDTEKKKKNADSGTNTNNTETGKGVETKEDKKKEEKTNGDESGSKSGTVETCDGVANSCSDGNFLHACIKDFGTAIYGHAWAIYVQIIKYAGLSGAIQCQSIMDFVVPHS
ncbi:hypothetical protein COLO4_06482 [Corchorus olitorius]|uniref:Uncharacterized protein n=1 Tax=Corchorus olitorius TaxID=93759 RepID=A0A1R3KMZ3_9ROSI|nr:hypothetical protein COLO4_06482 [Corchorus olitorius]